MKRDSDDPDAGAERLRRFMLDDPQIEALETSRGEHRIKVATIGPVSEEDLRERIGEVLVLVAKEFCSICLSPQTE